MGDRKRWFSQQGAKTLQGCGRQAEAGPARRRPPPLLNIAAALTEQCSGSETTAQEMPMELIGSVWCGSLIVELALALAGLRCTMTDVPYLQDGPARQRLLRLNPLGQVPTLVLEDGTVMTESAAILLYIDGIAPQAGLIPPPGAPGRAAFLNRLIWLVAAVYPTFTYGDEPARWAPAGEAADMLRERTDTRRQTMFLEWERDFGPGPFAAGASITALDLYLVAMTRWRPKGGWFPLHTPRLAAASALAAAQPALAPVVARHDAAA
jgi:GST-like protein